MFLGVFTVINIHRKTPVLESLFNKVAGLKACNYIKETPTQVFSCEYYKIFKNTYFEKHLRAAAPDADIINDC